MGRRISSSGSRGETAQGGGGGGGGDGARDSGAWRAVGSSPGSSSGARGHQPRQGRCHVAVVYSLCVGAECEEPADRRRVAQSRGYRSRSGDGEGGRRREVVEVCWLVANGVDSIYREVIIENKLPARLILLASIFLSFSLTSLRTGYHHLAVPATLSLLLYNYLR